MRLLGYIRVSRVMGREGDSFISPGDQRKRIETWCEAHGHELLDVHTDLDQSGGKTDRPEFQRALERCEAGDAGGIIVAKLDRFARSVSGAAATIERLDAAGCALVSVAENIDATGPGGRLMRTILFAFAEFERERLRESFATSIDHAVGRGVYVARTAPAGYTREPGAALVIDSAAAPAVVAAFEARAKGTPWATIGRQLAAVGVYPQGASAWSVSAVSYMIRNRAYLGEIWRGGRCVNPSAHEPLVGRALFEAANANRSIAYSRRQDRADGYLLTSLIRCAGCRYCMTGNTRHVSGRDATRYMCPRHHHASGSCPAPASITAAMVEQHVVDAFLARHDVVLAAAPADLSHLEQLAVEAEAELDAYVSVMRATDPGYRAGYDSRAADLERARRELAKAASESPVPVPPAELREHWQGATVAERRALLAADIDAVFVRPGRRPVAERVYVSWRGEGVEVMQRTGGKAPELLPPFEWADQRDKRRRAAA